MRSKSYTMMFAAAVTLVCSVLLASAATLLKDRQQLNIELNRKYNILRAMRLVEPGRKYNKQELLNLFDRQVSSFVVDTAGNKIPNMRAEDVKEGDKHLLPVYVSHKAGEIDAYCIPIQGKGLWSTIKGYLALEKDLNHVKGITFYSHGETPGLGGEIEKEWFTNNFIGKTIFDEQGRLVSITIVKGKLRPDAKGKEHKVDGISGATLTGRGVNNFLKANLQAYEPFFRKVRGAQQNGHV